MGKLIDYLVWESQSPPQPAMRTDLQGGAQQWGPPAPMGLVGYTCLGGVRAKDPEDACKAVVGATRRVGKYAVIEAVFIDFTTALEAPEGERPQLNP